MFRCCLEEVKQKIEDYKKKKREYIFKREERNKYKMPAEMGVGGTKGEVKKSERGLN